MDKGTGRYMLRFCQTALLVIVLYASAGAATYFVAPTGNDSLSGLSIESAWNSIDRADVLGIIAPGDTINILPGTYTRASSVNLTVSGATSLPIVYRRYGRSAAVIDMGEVQQKAIIVKSSYVKIIGLTVINGADNGIDIQGDGDVVSQCSIQHTGKFGIRIAGDSAMVERTVVAYSEDDAIKIENGGSHARLFNNTIYDPKNQGIEIVPRNCRVVNCIVALGNSGIKGPVGNVIAFNNVWGNVRNYDGVSDSAGGKSVQPQIVDPAAGRYDLRRTDLGIDAGLDVGLPYAGLAPDIGAIEKYQVYFVGPTGDDFNDGSMPTSSWRTLTIPSDVLHPGDTVQVLAGHYVDSVSVFSSGLLDDRLVFQGVPDSTVIDATGRYRGVAIAADYVVWSNLDVVGAINTNIQVSGNGVEIADCDVSGSNTYGVSVVSADHARLYRNRFYGNQVADVLLTNDSARVEHCTFCSVRYGIDALSSSGHAFVNNVLRGETGSSTGIRSTASSVVSSSVVHGYAQALQGGITLGAGCLAADPLLVDPAHGNLHLTSESPAIDAGALIGGSFVGSAPDIGAFETQTLDSIEITPNPSTLPADTQIQFEVVALGSDGYPAAYGELTWSHTFPTGSISGAGEFSPQLVGNGTVHVQSSIGDVQDSTDPFDVVAGRLSLLTLTASQYAVSADSALQFEVSGSDARGNSTPIEQSLHWGVSGEIGIVDSAGLFSATRAGKGVVTAGAGSVIGISDTVRVVAGHPTRLEVLPQTNIVQALQPYEYSAFTYDGDSNVVADVTDSATWMVTDTTGTIDAAGLYTAGSTPGDYFVQATSGPLFDSGAVSVVLTGGLSSIRIERQNGSGVNDTTFTTDQDFNRLYARGYDSDGLLIGDVVVTWHLIGTDSIGAISPSSGLSTVLSLHRAGQGRLVAAHSSGRVDTTGVITCVAGNAASLRISPPTDTISADSTVQFTYVALDADGNVTSLAGTPAWQTRGQIGSISPAGLFTPSQTGTGMVICSGAGLADTASPIVVVAGTLEHIEVSPDQLVLSADSGKQFSIVGFDAKGNVCSAGSISWFLTAGVGAISGTGLYTPWATGLTRVVAQSSLGPVDTTASLAVVAGALVSLTILPDSTTITVDDRVDFAVTGVDAHGNTVSPTTIRWKSVNGTGQMNSLGMYVPFGTGEDVVVATDTITDLSDTTAYLNVLPGQLRELVISPYQTTLRLSDTVRCSVTGYDATFSSTTVGTVTWSVLGGIGTIDSTGLFQSTQDGVGRIVAVSSIGGVADTSNFYTVEALRITAAAVGVQQVHPGARNVPVLVARIANPYVGDKALDWISLKYANRGRGNAGQMLSQIDTIAVFLDVDGDLSLGPSDSLLMAQPPTSDSLVVPLSGLVVTEFTERALIAAVSIRTAATDADTLDLYCSPAGVITIDRAPAVGASSINSGGYVLIDGMVAAQVNLRSVGRREVTPDDSLVPVFCADIPSNGYATDTLRSLRLVDDLGADYTSFDSLVLFADNGNGTWGGRAEERRLGRLVFTGEDYLRTGLQLPVAPDHTTIFVAAAINRYPVGGTRFAFGIPVLGIDVRSGNDGPVDQGIPPVDTISIQSTERIAVVSLPLAKRSVRPTALGGPVLSLQFQNDAVQDAQIDSIACRWSMIDLRGATESQLLSQVESLFVYLQTTADYQHISPQDILVAAAPVMSSSTRIDVNDVTIPHFGGRATLSFYVKMDGENARDGNRIGLEIEGAGSFVVDVGSEVTGTFPLRPDTLAVIDMFPASSVAVDSTASRQLRGGQVNQSVMSFALPRNGFATDALRRIRLENIGSLPDPAAISSLRLWRDVTGDGYSADDQPVGIFSLSGGQWQMPDVNIPLEQPTTRFIVTASISNEQFDGGTLRLEVPQGEIVYWSGATGPDDGAVANPVSHVVLPSNRITVISVPGGVNTVVPGARRRQLLAFALYNGYRGQPKTLTRCTFNNLSKGASSDEQFDAALGNVKLVLDANTNRVYDGDSLIASGYFANGSLRMNGLAVTLAPESLAYFFVVTDIPLSQTDGDSLAIGVAGATDLGFSEATTLNGDIPLNSGGYLVIDGAVKAQYEVLPVSGGSLQPGDSNVVVFAFRPAHNGSLDDILTSLTVTNQLDANASDIAALSLWQDVDDNGTLTSGDRNLGDFSYADGAWSVAGLSVPIPARAPGLFAVARISSIVSPNTNLSFALPVSGCQVASGNDGPRDTSLAAQEFFTLSNARLTVRSLMAPKHYTVGQGIPVSFVVINRWPIAIDGLSGMIESQSDSVLVRLDSSDAGPISLAAGDSTVMTFHFTALAAGKVAWKFRGFSSGGDSSAVITTPDISIDNPAAGVHVQLISTAPTAVSRGQANIFPLILRCDHLDDNGDVAPMRLDSLRLSFENLAGEPMSAGRLFRRLILANGYENRLRIDTVPDSPSVAFHLATPLVLRPGETQSFVLQLDIDSAATASGFRVVVSDASAIPFVDDNSGAGVPVTSSQTFPMRTAMCRINDSSPTLYASATTLLRRSVNTGQEDIPALQINLRHGGSTQSSAMQLASLTLMLVDSLNQPIWPSDIVSELKIRRGSFVLGERSNFAGDSMAVGIFLTSPLNFSAGQIDSVVITASLKDDPIPRGFRVAVVDSTALQVRDLNTGDYLVVVTDSSRLSAGTAFPMLSDYASILLRSSAPSVCVDFNLPDHVAAGADSTDLIQVMITNPGSVQQSPVRIDFIEFAITDSTGTPLDITHLFDRLGYRLGTGTVQYVTLPPNATFGAMRLAIGDSGIVLDNQGTMALQLVGDLDAAPQSEDIVIHLLNAGFLGANDYSDGALLQAALGPNCAATFPMKSSVAHIYVPAGRPAVSAEADNVMLAHPGAISQSVLQLTVNYTGESLQGDLRLDGLCFAVLQRSPEGLRPIDADAVFAGAHLTINETEIALDSGGVADSFRLTLQNPFAIQVGAAVHVTVRADIRSDAALGNYLVAAVDSGFAQLRDQQLGTAVYVSASDLVYPAYGTEISITAASLEGSFTNYPNPFVPSRGEETTIGYSLDQDAHVDIELYTVSGDLVKKVLTDAWRTSGSHNEDRWDGLNGAGRMVISGTYLCRITARYASGEEESLLRKVAVVR